MSGAAEDIGHRDDFWLNKNAPERTSAIVSTANQQRNQEAKANLER